MVYLLHPSLTDHIRIFSFKYLYRTAFVLSLSNSLNATDKVTKQQGELNCWWRFDAFMKCCIEVFILFSLANFSFSSGFSSHLCNSLLKSLQVAFDCICPVAINESVNSPGSWWNKPISALGVSFFVLPFLPVTKYTCARLILLLYLAWLCPADPSSPICPAVLSALVKIANRALKGSCLPSSPWMQSS